MAQISRRQSTPIATLPDPYGAIQASQLTTAGQAGVGRTEAVCLCACSHVVSVSSQLRRVKAQPVYHQPVK